MPSSHHDNPRQPSGYVLKVERAPLYVWLARVTWVIVLIILLEFAVTSWQEREPHAAVLASALLIVLLLAGVIAEVVRHVEARSPYRHAALPHEDTQTGEADTAQPQARAERSRLHHNQIEDTS